MTHEQEMHAALVADGEKLLALTGEDHGPWEVVAPECPKCGATSGDDWSQCEPHHPCPMGGHGAEVAVVPTETRNDSVMNATETVLLWNVRDEQPPHNLAEVIDALCKAEESIPAQYRESAHIDFDPYHDCAGEIFPQVCVTYSRPMTEAEADQYAAEESAHWVDQLRQAEQRAVYCRAQLGAKP